MSKRSVRRDDLLRFRIPGDVQLSRDGGRIVWTERHVDDAKMKSFKRLVGGETKGTMAALTDGPWSDGAPRWSPDGSQLAFVRSGIDERDRVTQLCVFDFSCNEVRVLVEREGTIGAPCWSPDGRGLAFAMRLADPVPDGMSTPVAIEVRRAHYKYDGEGYLPQDRYSLYRVEVEGGALSRLTEDGPWDDSAPTYSPDGGTLAFLSGRREENDYDFEHRDLYVMPAEGGEAKRVTAERMYAACPAWAPDGSWIALLGCVGKPFSALFQKNVELLRIDVSSGELTRLTASLDRCIMNLTIDDLWGLEHWEQAPAFVDGGKRLLFPVSHEGTTWLAQLEPDGDGSVERVIDDVVVVTSSVAAEAGKMALITTSADEPGRVELASLDGSDRELLAFPMRSYLDEVQLAAPIELRIDRDDAQVHGWLMLPEGDGPHPMLLSIHGGPIVQYGANFVHEIQCQVAAGFAVLFVNPRGSQGYGAEWARATHLDWATKPMADLIAAVDWAVAEHPIDPARLGILGGSYGGYMTTWIAAHDHRFVAACVQRTVSSMDALFWADFGIVLGEELEGLPWEVPERYARMSPLTYAAQIDTPMLVMQGLGDLRTPPDQGERLFLTLRALGKEVEMVLFPGASHGLSRGGNPRQRLERLERIEAWFQRHLLSS